MRYMRLLGEWCGGSISGSNGIGVAGRPGLKALPSTVSTPEPESAAALHAASCASAAHAASHNRRRGKGRTWQAFRAARCRSALRSIVVILRLLFAAQRWKRAPDG